MVSLNSIKEMYFQLFLMKCLSYIVKKTLASYIFNWNTTANFGNSKSCFFFNFKKFADKVQSIYFFTLA